MARKIQVLVMGLASAHGREFVVDRPKGLGSYLLMCFSTPFVCATKHGLKEGRAGDCVLHDPEFPQWHGPSPGSPRGFCNDWIHLRGPQVASWAAGYAIPFNTIIPLGYADALTDRLRTIEMERFHRKAFWEDAIEMELEALFLRIARLARQTRDRRALGRGERDHLEKFQGLREQFRDLPARPWTSVQMARLAGLGVNRFNVLYKKFFGVSPVDDLIAMRIERAKVLLAQGGGPVGEVAERSGFSSLYYFSRIFKKRVGCSPRAFAERGH